ncbi:hypothetical protein VTL71DRAFT_12344, partial [Oculimacula yallundae]
MLKQYRRAPIPRRTPTARKISILTSIIIRAEQQICLANPSVTQVAQSSQISDSEQLRILPRTSHIHTANANRTRYSQADQTPYNRVLTQSADILKMQTEKAFKLLVRSRFADQG